MKNLLIKFLFALASILPTLAHTQGAQTTINVTTSSSATAQALLRLPSDYAVATSKNYPIFIFDHGRGQAAAPISKIYNSSSAGGPAYFIAQNTWPATITSPRNGVAYDAIILSPQAPDASGEISAQELDYVIDYMYANYRVDTSRLYIIGISGGGQGLVNWAGKYQYNRRHKAAAIIPASAEIGEPSQTMINNYIADSTRVFGIGDAEGGDVLGTQTRVFATGAFSGNGGSVTVPPAYGNRFSSKPVGHNNWNIWLNPTYTELITPFYGGAARQMSLYEWALQFTQGASSGSGGNAAPVANAGTDKAITLPTATTTLTGGGTDVDGTIASYAWSLVSGTAGTISSPTAATTNITGLSTAGVRVYRLTVTDNLGATSTDDVQITVSAAAGSGTTKTVNVNLYAAATITSTAWNNWNILSGLTAPALKYDDGSSSSVTSVLSQQTGYSDNGATYAVTVLPQVVGRDVSYSTSSRTLTIGGLDNAKQYDLSLLATRGNAGQTTRFTIGSTSVDIATNSNFTNLATFTNVFPTSSQIVVTINFVAPALYNYLNAFVLTEKTASGGLSPVVNAGGNKDITLPTSTTTLTGSATDADGTISSYAWTQVSGTAASITSPASATTGITGLTTVGTRVFRLTATDNSGLTNSQTVNVTVSSASNTPPTLSPNGPITVTLPLNSTSLSSGAADSDGTISSYSWTQVSGTAATIASSTAASTNITGLTAAGVRVFRITVTDNAGATASADITVTVVASPGTRYVTQVAIGEYTTGFLLDDGTYRSTHWGGYLGVNRDTTALHSVSGLVEVTGGQYKALGRNAAGQVYILNKDNPNGGREGTFLQGPDYLGNPFTGNTAIFGAFTSFLSLKDGVPWMWGENDFLNLAGGNSNLYFAPRPFQAPTGKKIMKMICMEPVNNPMPGVILARADDGTVYVYNKNGGGIPIQVTGFTGPATDIVAITQFVYGIITANKLYLWGRFGDMVGVAANSSSPIDVTATWTAAGLQFPIKKAVSNWTCFFLLDNKNDLFGIGNNPHGNLGNGQQWPNWATKTPDPFAWDFQQYTYPQTTPVQIRGKFSNVWADGNLSNYFFVQDMGGKQLYSAGRNKAAALTNGIEVNNDEGYPEFGNRAVLGKVNPLTVTWPSGGGPTFVPSANQKPQVLASIDQYINTNTTTLYGLAHQQGTASVSVGNITSYAWTKLAGPAGDAIVSPTAATTNITGLQTGTYRYRLTVTSNVGAQTDTSSVLLFVDAPAVPDNINPVASANVDQTILFPASVVTLTGSGSDADGTVASQVWTRVSGPNTPTITSSTSFTTTVTGLTKGIYVFRLTVTDNVGASTSDDVQITVNTSPVVSAGSTQSITLPTNLVTLNGSASDEVGTITTYQWTQVSGPAGSLGTPTSAFTNAFGLVQGTYVFRLTVTDNAGATGFSDVTVIVSPAVEVIPVSTIKLNRGRRFKKAN